MNITNVKLQDVPKAFAALPTQGHNVKFAGKVRTNFDPNTHIQGLAAYRAFHLMTHSLEDQPSGLLLLLDRTPGRERLIKQTTLPAISQTPPFYFHAGGCQVIGDCLVLPVEDGGHRSVITFFDVSDPQNIVEVNPKARISRDFEEAGAAGVTNFSQSGKDHWLLAAYDNGMTDFYVCSDAFPGAFKQIFSKKLNESGHQSFSLITDASDQIFAIGLHRTALGKDMGTLYTIDLAKQTVDVVTERHFKTVIDNAGPGPHFRWGAGIELVSATELALFCSSHRYDDGCDISGFDATTLSMRAAVRIRRRKPSGAAKKARRRRK